VLQAVTRTLFIEIDDAQAWSLTDATLQCGDVVNKLPLGTLAPGDQVTVTLDADAQCPAGSEMLLHFIDENGRTTVDPVLDGD
jgi:hypothetical protein